MKKTLIYILAILFSVSVNGQKKDESTFKREINIYNPYKPSLPDVVKKSFLPDMTDTAKVRPDFKYDVRTYPFSPPYTVTPIKAAALLPDALPKLYNSYINIGMGNYLSPLGEFSITNQRSKKGNIGLYARHFSTNGKVELDNLEKVFAGYMDNDAMIYGRRFFKSSILRGKIDFAQKTRYAYGYDTGIIPPGELPKEEIKLGFINTGASIGLESMKLDSSKMAYDFGIDYHYFTTGNPLYQYAIEFNGELSKMYKGFYMGGKIDYGFYNPNIALFENSSKYMAAVSPFVYKKTAEWNVKLGFQALVERGLEDSKGILHIYPDVSFGFSIVPSYIEFFAELKGKLERNDPVNVIAINPFVYPDESLYNIRNTDDALIINAGLRGETGVEGTYHVSASYSVINDMLFFSNSVVTGMGLAVPFGYGNYFIPLYDEAEILNVHGDWSGKISGKISLETSANYYKYTMAESDYAWNRPDWDASIGVNYNLRNKIIAKASLNALGRRHVIVTREESMMPEATTTETIALSPNVNMSLSAEYRYTKILSFWVRLNGISFSRYYEWAYYPTQRFLCQVGFTYSL